MLGRRIKRAINSNLFSRSTETDCSWWSSKPVREKETLEAMLQHCLVGQVVANSSYLFQILALKYFVSKSLEIIVSDKSKPARLKAYLLLGFV